MGTNYYLVKNAPTCRTPVHIGKSSIGWMFGFQDQDERWEDPPIVWHTYNQVKATLQELVVEKQTHSIVDEYDEVISFEDFCELVDTKQERDKDNKDNFTYNKNVDGYRFTDAEFC